jgi:hypothetical protein
MSETTPKQVLAWLENDQRHEEAGLAKAKTQKDRQMYRATIAAYRTAIRYVEELILPIVLNANPSFDDYDRLAAKFEVARWGNGPGISEEDLAEVGLKKTKTFSSKAAGRTMKVDESWESLCCFVYEKLTGQTFPEIHARGRGFRSQSAGKHVITALTEMGIRTEEVA